MGNASETFDSPRSINSDASELRCPACDYDLRGLLSERCPECGLLLDRAGMLVSQIPWTHRREMGRFRAFRRTCWMVFRRPKRLAADVARPVSFTDAKRFQRVVLLTAYLPLLTVGLWALFANADEHPFRRSGTHGITWRISSALPDRPEIAPSGRWLGWVLEGLGVVIVAICLWLFLKAATGVASYFFHPRELSVPRQNRAIALSYYACAPLAWTPVSLALYGLAILFAWTRWSDSPLGAQIKFLAAVSLFISVAAQVVGWWRATLVLLKQTTRCSGARVLTAAILLPFLWILCGIITLCILPAAYLFVCAVILSLLH